jgi:hypothetical protein
MKKSQEDRNLGLDRVMKRMAAEITQAVREGLVRELCEIVRTGATSESASRRSKPTTLVPARPAKRVAAKTTKPVRPIAGKQKAKPARARSVHAKPAQPRLAKAAATTKAAPGKRATPIAPPRLTRAAASPPRHNGAAGTSPRAR